MSQSRRFRAGTTLPRLALVIVAGVAGPVAARSFQDRRPTTCNQPAPEPIVHLAMPGRPFQAVPSNDGCWIFVAMNSTTAADNGVGVVRRNGGRLQLVRVVRTPGSPTGSVLTHDGKVLIVAAGDRVEFLDAGRLSSGDRGALMGSISEPDAKGDVNVNVSADDRWLFVAEERSAAIGVIDLARARSAGFTAAVIVGHIPTGNAPIAVVPSADGRLLFTTSQAAPPDLGWPRACRPEGSPVGTPPNHAEGAILVADMARAVTDTSHAVVASVPAGCNPVRLVLSPDGRRTYVTARGDDALLVFDTSRLASDPGHAQIAKIPVGTAPVGVAVVNDGQTIVVTNSNRFAGSAADHQSLTVIDASKLSLGAGAIAGSIPAGGFPREVHPTADGRTLLLTNFTSQTVEMIDLARLPQILIHR